MIAEILAKAAELRIPTADRPLSEVIEDIQVMQLASEQELAVPQGRFFSFEQA